MGNKLYEESSIQAIADAIRSKNGLLDTYTVAQMASAIEAIESGGSITFKTGTVTFTEEQSSEYIFVDDKPDLFILYIEQPLKNATTSQQPDDIILTSMNVNRYLWSMVQYKRSAWKYYSTASNVAVYINGWMKGTSKYYTSRMQSASKIYLGKFSTGLANTVLGAVTYRWFAFYGIEEFI